MGSRKKSLLYVYGIIKGIVHRTEECHGTHSDDALRALRVLRFAVYHWSITGLSDHKMRHRSALE